MARIVCPNSAPIAFSLPPLKSATACGLSAITLAAVSRSAPSSFTILSPCSSTYFSGSISSWKICLNTSFATELLMVPASARSINFARFSGENVKSSGSIPLSFIRRKVSPISQFATFFGFSQIAVVASKRSAIFLEPVMISASYCGISNCSL